ncbi:MAG: hypothetical protein ACK5UE_04540 [Chitinophagales bacterium]|jgi:hypothetical protein|nr:hypothetical protein [Sphingobacteriales bacterium]
MRLFVLFNFLLVKNLAAQFAQSDVRFAIDSILKYESDTILTFSSTARQYTFRQNKKCIEKNFIHVYWKKEGHTYLKIMNECFNYIPMVIDSFESFDFLSSNFWKILSSKIQTCTFENGHINGLNPRKKFTKYSKFYDKNANLFQINVYIKDTIYGKSIFSADLKKTINGKTNIAYQENITTDLSKFFDILEYEREIVDRFILKKY